MWLTSLAIEPLWHSQAEAEASGRAAACECSSPGHWALGAWLWLWVEALSSDLSLVVLSFMFVEYEAPGGSEQSHSILV
jgi:hypothetical protein